MNIEKLTDELNQIHIDQAKQLSQIANALSSSGETGVLLWLRQQQGDVFAVDIIEHFGLTPGRVANIVKKLESKGYISRQHTFEDLRKSSICLTDSGTVYADELYRQMSSNHKNIINSIGEEKILESMENLKKLIALMDDGMKIAQIK